MASTTGHELIAQQQKLPAGLAGVLNKPEEMRDSAYYSATGSKHSSTQSHHALPPLESLGRADSSSVTDTPSPVSTGGHITHPLNSPASATGAMSVNSIISPIERASFQYTYENNPNSPAMHSMQYPEQHMGAASSLNGDSRRESVDSRLGVNFSDMRLASGTPYAAGRSPYTSANQSTTSLQSSLAQQRNPGSAHPDRNSGPFRLSNGFQQPSFQQMQRVPDGHVAVTQQSRIAPPITGPTMGAIARAPEPTKGQGWAFPEEEVQRIPSAARPSQELANRGGDYYDDSRRNSYADSIASSQYTTESRLPPGQRRLEDGIPAEYQPSRGSSEYQVSTHHHSLQNRQVSQLRHTSPTSSVQPYSRTPELRVSHKLAERKRRTEMKDLFDTLRNTQGVERGAKASKWEILTKAISEHNRQKELIDSQARTIHRQEQQTARLEHDLDLARRETQQVRMQLEQLRAEFSNLTIGNAATHSYNTPGPTPISPTHGYGSQQEQLPPLRSISGAETMNGVQYQVDPRTNGFRPADRF